MLTIPEILFLISKGLNNIEFYPNESGHRRLKIFNNKLYSTQTGFTDTLITESSELLDDEATYSVTK